MTVRRRLGPEDLGKRVVVRHRLPDGRGTDVLGELIAADEDVLVVRDRHGTDHRIAQTAIIAGKPIPPAPPRRASGLNKGEEERGTQTDDG
ncbi:hypothetical protein ACQBAR_05275 [Propionibacteriaceae bacterium Y1685]|uniref:putative acetyltransferase n=1 Tax=Microlunatus sp. Y1700 TaxID=3418487 RepID=UPI003B7CF622